MSDDNKMTSEISPVGCAASEAVPFAVTLGESVDISGIEALSQSLSKALAAVPSVLLLNAEAVGRIDGASLQLLAVFCRAARTQGLCVTWQKPSSVLLRSAQLLGLTGSLELKDAA